MEELQKQITNLQVQNRFLLCLIEAFMAYYSKSDEQVRNKIYYEANEKHSIEEDELASHQRP